MLAQIHLAFNHFPFVGAVLATLILILSLVPRFVGFRKSALLLFILSAMLSLPAYFSGEGAEDVLRSGTEFPRTLIHNHEEWAEKGFIAILVLGGGAVVLLWLERKREVAKIWYALLVVGALLVCVLFGQINHLGGLISHPELRSIPSH